MGRKLGSENGSGDCPTTPGSAQTRSQPKADRAARPKTAVAIVSLRMAFGVPHSYHAVRHSRTTRWRLHLLSRISSFLSFQSSRRRARLAFAGLSPLPFSDVTG